MLPGGIKAGPIAPGDDGEFVFASKLGQILRLNPNYALE